MALITVQKLEKSFGGRTLFSDVSFEIGAKDHVGFVGANGTGKTTLFKILLSQEEADSGEVHRAKLLRMGTLAQAPDVRAGQTLYSLVLDVFSGLMELERAMDDVNARLLSGSTQALIDKQNELRERYEREGGLTYRSRVRSALLGLGFSEEELLQDAATLSGGQLNKAMLAQVLLSGADLLLLDEPTNHLDIQAVEWLEGYLKTYAGAYIVISHDRYFLDQVTTRTLELKHAKLYQSNGNYSRHIEQRATGQEIARRHYYNTQKEIRRIYGIVEQQRRWNRERNIRTAESKLKQIERLKKTLVEPEKEEAGIRFAFHMRAPGGNDVLMAEDMAKAYGEKKLFSDVSLHIRTGERVFLLGPNGCGKTTLLRILMGKESADAGGSYFGVGVESAYYEQNMRSMRDDNTALKEVWDAYPRMSRTEVRNALAAFLFRGDDVEKRIGDLSGGERARIQLLKLMLSGANILLLDEPTNHLDIASREALEQALEGYEGAMLIVTHDRYLVNRLADRVLYMRPDGLVETVGGYDAFLEALGEEKAAQKQQEPEKPKNAYQEQKEKQSALARAKSAQRRAEQDVEDKEAQIAGLEEALSAPGIAADYMEAGRLSKELDARRAELEACYHIWEEAEKTLLALQEE